MIQVKRTGALAFLVIVFLISAQIGNTFSQALTIFSILMWTMASLMFGYLMLFKGMTLSFLRKKDASPANDVDYDFEDENAFEDGQGDAGGGQVVPFHPPHGA